MLVTELFELAAYVVMAGVALAIYSAPMLVAQHRNAPHLPWIFILNLWLGWTGIGWAVAMVWALSDPA